MGCIEENAIISFNLYIHRHLKLVLYYIQAFHVSNLPLAPEAFQAALRVALGVYM